ncbi:MAG: hypothetical protein RMY00_08770 [Nostoc sp. ChiVER01]|nr:hypothetical protein [Nostoc sp. ChiVER01]MDZ8223054.1 hypothetical protein [Nostoc sp. ChiVER01]
MMERSLSQWDCTELARQVITATIVGSISASTVFHHRLQQFIWYWII